MDFFFCVSFSKSNYDAFWDWVILLASWGFCHGKGKQINEKEKQSESIVLMRINWAINPKAMAFKKTLQEKMENFALIGYTLRL